MSDDEDPIERFLSIAEAMDSRSLYGVLRDDGSVEALSFSQYLRRVREAGGEEQLLSLDQRRIGRTTYNGLLVSTVFLWIDHGWSLDGAPHKPLWFETMVFDDRNGEGPALDVQQRYETYAEAIIGHNAVVCRVVRGEVRGG